MGNQLPHLRRDTIAFVAHDDDSQVAISDSIRFVHIPAFEQSAIERDALKMKLLEHLGQVHIVQSHACEGTHSGLYHLRIKAIRRITGTEYVVNTKPITCANDGT